MRRSYEPLIIEDLKRLGVLAKADRVSLFDRKPDTGKLYRNRLFAVALCQGAALHFLYGKNGIKDFDVWSFYTEAPERPFPFRRRGVADFGNPKFGKTEDSPSFIGRRVDLLARSLKGVDPNDPVGSLRKYLSQRATKSAYCLAEKAVILIEPADLLGYVVWPVIDR